MKARRCLACLRDLRGDGEYHARCAKALFGTARVPSVDVDLAKLHTVALAMVGHTSLSGIQRKVSLGLTTDRATLRVAAEGGDFILKPQAQTFPNLPENEHVTMLMGTLAGIEIPPCGLVQLRDGSNAYIVRRFDRVPKGKLMQEDFCQLAELSPKQKYEGSAELCARMVRRYATETVVEMLKLFRLVVFTWWCGNGDMHLKNFSLLRGPDGVYRLSPAYDMLCTSLVIPDDPLALPVGGNKKDIRPREWREYAQYCKLPAKAAARVMSDVRDALVPALDLVARSALPPEMQEHYAELLTKRTKLLART
ncbi:MAG TPA: HipA domain-containing protein [Anaeromyxobacteraceae bacterium]|nr:HipA domain-containing protein [Anaeromyxobacteraceae bacterium]